MRFPIPKRVRKALVRAQFIFWPDSKIHKDDVVFTWVAEDARVTPGDREQAGQHWNLILDNEEDKFLGRELKRLQAQVHAQERALRTAQSCMVALLNDPSGARVFYECGANGDGTYKWRGCRFGLNGSEYQSGFSRY